MSTPNEHPGVVNLNKTATRHVTNIAAARRATYLKRRCPSGLR